MQAAQETQQAFRYLQMQEGRIHQIQQQHYGGVSGAWNVGAAYRPPDSNVNISVGYQQGRTNIQISMVPDEQSSLLGPNGEPRHPTVRELAPSCNAGSLLSEGASGSGSPGDLTASSHVQGSRPALGQPTSGCRSTSTCSRSEVSVIDWSAVGTAPDSP